MADRFVTITRQTATKWLVSGRIVDSESQQTTLVDLTGANAITVDFTNFVQLASRLSTAQQDELANMIINFFITAFTQAGS